MILQKINNVLGRMKFGACGPQKLRSERGQVVLVILLVAAFAFILFAVILNYSKISQSKTQVTIASNIAAGYMASFIASYGESLFRTSLGGDTEVCGWTGIFAAILTFIIVIIAIVAAIFQQYYVTAALLALIVVLAAAGIVMSALAESALTDKFNKLMAMQLGPTDLVVERGIMTALNNTVTDSKFVQDKVDLDQDRLYGTGPGGVPKDMMSRFSYYYLERLKSIKPRSTNVLAFINALKDLVYTDSPAPGPNWGLYDPYPTSNPCGETDNHSSPNKPSVCDPCCLPAMAFEPTATPPSDQPVRPACCVGGTVTPTCGDPANCGSRIGNFPSGNAWADPFPNPMPPTGIQYKWLYRPFIDDDENNEPIGMTPGFLSFREKIGQDDSIRYFKKQAASPPNFPGGRQTAVVSPFPFWWQEWDASGFYRSPTFGNLDREHGIYSTLYRIYDGKVDLNSVYNGTSGLASWAYREMGCHWCSSQGGFPAPLMWDSGITWPLPDNQCPQMPAYSGLPSIFPPFYDRLVLPGPYNPLSGSGCVDAQWPLQTPPVLNQKALRPDKVAYPVRWVTELGVQHKQNLIGWWSRCADDSFYHDLWKHGADQYCQTDHTTNTPYHLDVSEGWPYSQLCITGSSGSYNYGKHAGCTSVSPYDCTCTQAVADHGGYTPGGSGLGDQEAQKWPDDTLDNIMNGITDFLIWAKGLLDADPMLLGEQLPDWYPEAAEWIENIGSCSNLTEPGKLWKWLADIGNWHSVLQTWLDGNAKYTQTGIAADIGVDYLGATVTDTWCYPDLTQASQTGPMYMPPNEELFIDNACLNPVFPIPPGCPNVGGAQTCCVPNSTHGPYNPAPPNFPSAPRFKTAIDKVVSCMVWNVNDPIPESHWITGKFGNYEKFTLCSDTYKCMQYWDTVCHPQLLPRSLVLDSDYNQSNPGNPPGSMAGPGPQTPPGAHEPQWWQKQMMYCLEGKPGDPTMTACSAAACQPMLNSPGNGLPFFINSYQPPAPGFEGYKGWGDSTWFLPPYITDPGLPVGHVPLNGDWAGHLSQICTASPGNGVWGFGNGNYYYNVILSHLTTVITVDPTLAGACVENSDTTPPNIDYVPFVQQSAGGAQNQVAKIRKRAEYLAGRPGVGGWEGIVDLVKDFANILDEAYSELDTFLIGPAADLVQQYCTWGNADPPLPSQVIYAWQDIDPKKVSVQREQTHSPGQRGYWHIVRADMRVPQRCAVFDHSIPPNLVYGAACDGAQTYGADTPWPRIKTYTESWGTRRCYKMDKKRGTVKARVARFDEDKDPGVLKFPMGADIWKPKFTNPLSPSYNVGGTDYTDVNNGINTSCNPLLFKNQNPLYHPYFPPEATRALMMNEDDASGLAPNCWDVLNIYLQHGVYEETCAQYYLKENSPSTGFQVKFVPCQYFDDPHP